MNWRVVLPLAVCAAAFSACQLAVAPNGSGSGFTDGTADIPEMTGDQGAVLVQLPSPTAAARSASAIPSSWAASTVDSYMVIVYNDTHVVGGQTLATFEQVHTSPTYYTMNEWNPGVGLALDPGTYRVVAFAGKRAQVAQAQGVVFLLATATADVTITKGHISQVSAQFRTCDLSITFTENRANPYGVFYAGQQFGVTFAGSYGATSTNKSGGTFSPVRMVRDPVHVKTRFEGADPTASTSFITDVYPSEPTSTGSWSAAWIATAPAQSSDDLQPDGLTPFGGWEIWYQGSWIQVLDADYQKTAEGLALTGTYTEGGLASLTNLSWAFPCNWDVACKPDPSVPAGYYQDWFQVGPNNASVNSVHLAPAPTGAEFTFAW